MIRIDWLRRIAMVSLIALLPVTAGCGLFKSSESGQIDPPQGEIEETAAMNENADGIAVDSQQKNAQVTLYFKDKAGYVAPISMNIPYAVDIATQALPYMVEGGPGEDMLPEGFTSLLPKGTEIKGINILPDEKLAVVDFSKEFTDYNPQDERKILEALTWTLTGFPTIDQVQIWVDGKVLKEMPVDGTPLDEPLSRAMGINIERAEGVDLGQSTPVTLYFAGQTDRDFEYFVPITRMIQRTDDVARAALAELVKGPNQPDKLGQTVSSAVEVLNVKKSEDLVTVNFNDKILDADQLLPAEALQSVVLSLADTTGESKVQIMVNGSVKVNSTDHQNYSAPVVRPAHINPLAL